jgi:hypothetical protein
LIYLDIYQVALLSIIFTYWKENWSQAIISRISICKIQLYLNDKQLRILMTSKQSGKFLFRFASSRLLVFNSYNWRTKILSFSNRETTANTRKCKNLETASSRKQISNVLKQDLWSIYVMKAEDEWTNVAKPN